ncbi:MAG: TetR/AcrR family transcriptional regulator [Betaproteobacteria bacterium]
MSRPSRNIDQILLGSGRVLYPQLGCAGLSLRQLASHAGVNVGMFHYHFQSKDNFLRTLLQQLYDELFAQLQIVAAEPGTPLERLRHALNLLGRLMRDHGAWITRIWIDASHGEVVAQDFLRRNARRHVLLLMTLGEQACAQGSIDPMPALQRFSLLMGAVVAPMVVVPGALRLGLLPAALARQAQADVLGDAAIAERVDRVLASLSMSIPLLEPVSHG